MWQGMDAGIGAAARTPERQDNRIPDLQRGARWSRFGEDDNADFYLFFFLLTPRSRRLGCERRMFGWVVVRN